MMLAKEAADVAADMTGALKGQGIIMTSLPPALI
jgi:hypothetical protein